MKRLQINENKINYFRLFSQQASLRFNVAYLIRSVGDIIASMQDIAFVIKYKDTTLSLCHTIICVTLSILY